MLSEKIIEQLTERLVNRIEKGNAYVLEQIGKSIKKIGTLSPSKAQELVNVLKYGGSYEKIVNKLAEITNLNVRDIYKIFEEVAKHDYKFAKQFYDYRGIDYIPYEQNIALQNQVRALAAITAREYVNISNTLAFTKKDKFGHVIHTELSRAYQNAIDEAVLAVSQGKDTFQDQMYKTIKELGSSGLKTVDYANGRSTRLDSAVRMHLQSALRNLHNETQKQFGKEFDADGVEISVHSNPAPDHEEVQGRQFSNEEFEKFQNNQDSKDYQGKTFTADFEGHDRRSISEYNCYHYVFSIVLGVSKPEYTIKQLQQIIDDNHKGFELDGKHYTNYEGTQLQRRLETEIRKQKDIQIAAKASGNEQLIGESQQRITELTHKYKELSDASGLPTKMDRLRVSGYKRTKVSEFNKDNFIDFSPKNSEELVIIGKEYFDFKSNESLDYYVTKTSNIKTRIQNGDVGLKSTLEVLEPEIDKLGTPSKIDFKLYSAKDITEDYSKDKHLLSGTISKQIANIHNNKKINKETITIYVEKGAKIISTYNTTNKQFNRQGEIILPTNKRLKRIDKYNYILKK